ncbi:MAG: T9SS type A sorting domain-containing protein [bacterium]|nr:T9SS type A sorting domain-containing protein [bacterium]
MSSPTNYNLNSVFFVDSSYGWAVGDSGIIIHTSNGGTDWIIQDSKTLNNIKDVYFLNKELGWAIYWEYYNFPFGTYVLKTTDGGVNWISFQEPEKDIFSQCIVFLDSLNGWMGGKGTPFVKLPIVKTIDGGRTWRNAVIDSSNFSTLPVFDIKFYNDKYGYACGGAIDCCGIIWWTNNGGDFWYVIDTPAVALDPINQLHLIDSLQVLAVGGDFESLGYGVEIVRTSDGGLNWNFEHIGIAGSAWDIDFRTDKEVWAPLGGEGKLIYSLDSGKNWSQIFSPHSLAIFELTFPDSLHGIGVGNGGAIIKYRPDSTSGIIDADKLFAKEFNLEQNYPNPFNPLTTISFSIPEKSFVNLKVFDIIGNEIETLFNGELSAGSHKVEFLGKNKTSGIYFYKLNVGDFTKTLKMLLLK